MTGAPSPPARRRDPCPGGLLLVALSMLTPASLALAQDPLGAVRNQSVEVSGNVVTVGYELVADNPGTIFSVALDFSQNAGQSYLRARSVTGDVGPEVTSGPGKQIVWDAARDTESLSIGQFVYRVVIETASVPTTGSLAVTSEPPGAMVVVDGVGRGLTPLDLDRLTPGEYRVTLSLIGYLDNAQVVTLVAGSDETLSVTLTSAPRTGAVDASTGGGRNLALIIAGLGGAAAAAAIALAASGDDVGPPGTPIALPQATCTYSISPTATNVDPAGGSISVQITSGTGCGWEVTSRDTWLRPTGTSPTSGFGNATVIIEAAGNNTAAVRTGTVSIAGQTLTITQEAGELTETLTDTVLDTSPICTFTVDLPNTDGTDPCRQFRFTASSGGQVTATLTWTDGAADLDLYLVRGGNILAMSLQALPTVTETVTATVPAGNYSLAVHYWSFNPPGPGLRQRCSPAQTCPTITFRLTVTRPR